MSATPINPIPSREGERYSAYHGLVISYEGSSESVPVRVPDVSTHGMFINTGRYFSQGSVVRVSFRLTRSNYEVQVRAEVRYCLQGVGIGVEFLDITPEAQQAIVKEYSR